VHEHFDEQLYYLLLSVKPLNERVFIDALKQLLNVYGVSRFCFYQVYGNFDVLLRIWLPPRHFREFVRKATNALPNVQSLIHFLTEAKVLCSAFNVDEGTGHGGEKLPDLDVERVREAQNGDPQAMKEMADAGLLKVKSAGEVADERRKIKVFVALSEPFAGIPLARRKLMVQEIKQTLGPRNQYGFEKVTLLHGTGFCWVLAKFLCEDFQKLGTFVHEIAESYGGEGLATSTFLVASQEKVIEGECVSGVALQAYGVGDRRVAGFLPELYRPGIVSPTTLEQGAIEDFVTKRILQPPKEDALDQEDSTALRDFFAAVIGDNREEAFVALYPRIVRTEGVLRRPIEPLAKSCEGNVPALLAYLQNSDKNTPKNLERLTLLDLLRSARWILERKLPDDPWVKANLSDDEQFKRISDCRNAVMHAKPFEPRSDWKSLAEAALKMFLLRAGIETRYRKLLAEADQQRTDYKV